MKSFVCTYMHILYILIKSSTQYQIWKPKCWGIKLGFFCYDRKSDLYFKTKNYHLNKSLWYSLCHLSNWALQLVCQEVILLLDVHFLLISFQWAPLPYLRRHSYKEFKLLLSKVNAPSTSPWKSSWFIPHYGNWSLKLLKASLNKQAQPTWDEKMKVSKEYPVLSL